MTTKVILLNGPIGCGKDEAATYCERYLSFCYSKQFKKKLFDLVMMIYDVSPQDFWNIYNNRELKEKPLALFGGLSVRQAMIKVSEEVIKPNYGKEYFGKAAVKSCKKDSLNIFSDSGFIEEVQPLFRTFGVENVLLVRIYGRGSFEGDSRNYLDPEDFAYSVDVQNNKTLEAYLEKICSITESWWYGVSP